MDPDTLTGFATRCGSSKGTLLLRRGNRPYLPTTFWGSLLGFSVSTFLGELSLRANSFDGNTNENRKNGQIVILTFELKGRASSANRSLAVSKVEEFCTVILYCNFVLIHSE